jgi:hypothetical protein
MLKFPRVLSRQQGLLPANGGNVCLQNFHVGLSFLFLAGDFLPANFCNADKVRADKVRMKISLQHSRHHSHKIGISDWEVY